MYLRNLNCCKVHVCYQLSLTNGVIFIYSSLLAVTEMRISKAQNILIDMTYKRARLELYLIKLKNIKLI